MVGSPHQPETTVSDSLANAQLELCCRVGSVDGLLEALEDGADINCSGGLPLYVAIMARDRVIVSALVQNGADPTIFEVRGSDQNEIVDALLALAPTATNASDAPQDDADPVDAKLVRAFDKMIRSKGFGEPLRKGRGSDYPAFRKRLMWIASEECEGCVAEFIGMAEAGLEAEGREGTLPFLEENATRISELSERYRAAPEVPVDLLKDYLKERKKGAD